MESDKVVDDQAGSLEAKESGPEGQQDTAIEHSGQRDENKGLARNLSITDRFLTPIILLFMIIGVIIGEFAPNQVQKAFDTARFESVSAPIAIGLIVMMWPIMTKVEYESLPNLFTAPRLWLNILSSLIINWIFGPLLMTGLAWATLPDLPTYRAGVILVGLARCIAMVMIWNQLARGDGNYCAILVIVNSVLQIVLYSPYAVLFINVIGGEKQTYVHVSYREVAISVLIYLGIPLAAGLVTRFTLLFLTSRAFLEKKFLPVFSPLALLGLLYTIIIIFASQGHHILQNLGPTFRVFVPLILYFIIMWTGAFLLFHHLSRRPNTRRYFGYEVTVAQAFTAGSNNFELAIAVAVAAYGPGSDQALAATIGPLVEVPVLLSLTWVALYLQNRLSWAKE